MTRLTLAVLSAALLAGCLSQPPAPTVDRAPPPQSKATPPAGGSGEPVAVVENVRTYTVKKGDTLYRIALEHGQDYRDVAAWNNLTNPGSIKEGQVLRVSPPGAVVEAGGAVVSKPIASGAVVESRPLDRPAQPAANDGVKREPKVGKEPYSDEAYARLNKVPGSAAADGKSAESVKPADTKPAEAPVAAAPDDVTWTWPVGGKVLQGFGQAGSKGLDIAGKAGDPVLAAGDGKVVYAGNGLPGYGELVIVKHNATYLSAYGHNRKILVKEGQSVSRGQKIAEMGNTGTDAVKLHFEIRKQGNPIDPTPLLPKK